MIQLSNKNELNSYIQQMGQRIEKALIYQLEYLVQELTNHAKEEGEYNDITSNLRSSIGGVLLKNGKPIQYKGFVGSGEGTSNGRSFINTLMSQYGTGYVIILVAGMEYAAYVEGVVHKNVLARSELKMYNDMPTLMNNLKQRISKMK